MKLRNLLNSYHLVSKGPITILLTSLLNSRLSTLECWVLPTSKLKSDPTLLKVSKGNRYLKYTHGRLSSYWSSGRYDSFWTLGLLIIRRSLTLRLLYLSSNQKLWNKFKVMNVSEQINLLRTSIKKAPKTMPSRRIYIPKANSKELRPLSVPRLEMRILNGVTNLVLSVTVFSWISDNQFGFTIGRSITGAWRRLLELVGVCHLSFVKRGLDWSHGVGIYEYDISKFFDSISKELLRETYSKIFKCNTRAMKFLSMMDSIPCMDGRKLKSQSIGVPQGFAISPIIANACLEQIGFLKTDGLSGMIIQFADDGLLISPKSDLSRDISSLRSRLAGGITFNEEKSGLNTSGIIKFLGLSLDLNTGNLNLATRSGRKSLVGPSGFFLSWLKEWHEIISRNSSLPPIEETISEFTLKHIRSCFHVDPTLHKSSSTSSSSCSSSSGISSRVAGSSDSASILDNAAAAAAAAAKKARIFKGSSLERLLRYASNVTSK